MSRQTNDDLMAGPLPNPTLDNLESTINSLKQQLQTLERENCLLSLLVWDLWQQLIGRTLPATLDLQQLAIVLQVLMGRFVHSHYHLLAYRRAKIRAIVQHFLCETMRNQD